MQVNYLYFFRKISKKKRKHRCRNNKYYSKYIQQKIGVSKHLYKKCLYFSDINFKSYVYHKKNRKGICYT